MHQQRKKCCIASFHDSSDCAWNCIKVSEKFSIQHEHRRWMNFWTSSDIFRIHPLAFFEKREQRIWIHKKKCFSLDYGFLCFHNNFPLNLSNLFMRAWNSRRFFFCKLFETFFFLWNFSNFRQLFHVACVILWIISCGSVSFCENNPGLHWMWQVFFKFLNFEIKRWHEQYHTSWWDH